MEKGVNMETELHEVKSGSFVWRKYEEIENREWREYEEIENMNITKVIWNSKRQPSTGGEMMHLSQNERKYLSFMRCFRGRDKETSHNYFRGRLPSISWNDAIAIIWFIVRRSSLLSSQRLLLTWTSTALLNGSAW